MKKKSHSHMGLLHRALSLTMAATLMFAAVLPAVQRAAAQASASEETGSYTVTFEDTADAQKFALYQSSSGGFGVQDGKMIPVGEAGELKAIYQDEGAAISCVSVDIYPGQSGINGGLYINAKNPGNDRDQIDALSIMVQANHTGWEDAPNRIDLVTCSFPAWKELKREVFETGAGNNLYSGGVREPVNLKVEIDGNLLTTTLSLLSDPSRAVSSTYVYQGAGDLSLGDVGIRSDFSDASYDNFTVTCKQLEQAPTQVTVTETVNFNSGFAFYQSSSGGFEAQGTKLVPTGEGGEFKAIYQKVENAQIDSVSVDIYPGTAGINGGLYIGAKDPGNGQDQIDALGIMVESNFTGWADAPNRIDLITCTFPAWTELQRVISETGAGNNLFSGGVKEPVKLRVDISDNQVTATLSLLSDESKYITTTYHYQGAGDLSLGDVGIRSQYSDAAYENFTVTYTAPKPAQAQPTDLVDFETQESSEKFDFYHSSNGGFAVQEGKLVPTGEDGEFKAIYKDENASFSYVSVDIYPGEKGINGGLYLDVTEVGHPVDRVEGLYIGIESDFPKAGEASWEDAPNRTDLVIGTFPQWQELHRVISETGAGNSLFTGGVKEPVKLEVAIDGNRLTVTVSLLSNPYKQISTTYVYENGQDLALGNVGIRSAFNDASYDNFTVIYSQVEEDKQPDQTEPEETVPEETIPQITPSDIVDFETQGSAEKFDFYHSSSGGLTVQEGKLVPVGETGEFKAIYRDGGDRIQGVSVNIYPGQSGQINSGIYIGTSTVEDGEDRIKGLAVMVESNFSGWEDAVNRIDLVVGRFPIWKELHRYVSETGNGNALFAGAKEPLNLSVFLSGNELTVKLSLLSDPEKYVTTVYEYNGATELPAHNVGLRSAFNDVSFDDFAVYSLEGGGSRDPDRSGTTDGVNTTPDTGDHFRPEAAFALMVFAATAIVVLEWKKNKLKTQGVSQ